MEHSFTVTPDGFAGEIANANPAAAATATVDAPTPLSDEQQAAVAAVWAITNTGVADQYEVSIASSDEGGWTVVRVAAVHKEG